MSKLHPVVLVHGINDTEKVFDKMGTYLYNLGWSVYGLNLSPNNGSGSLESLGEKLQEYINSKFSPTENIDIVAFSMGGLVSRYYIQRLGGVDRVKRYVNISAPNRGTLAAYAFDTMGILQMRPQSDFLQDLNRDYWQILAKIQVTTIWTPLDLIIIPPKSSCLGIGKEINLPVLLHPLMLTDNRVLKLVAQALKEPVIDY